MAYLNPVPDFELESNNSTYNETVENEADYTPINKVYFAFIDVLGFKKTFDDMKITKETIQADKYRDVFNYYFALMNSARFMESGSSTGCYAGQTSDSLYFYTERIDYLMQFIKIFSHFSMYAMSQDVFFRGGIAKGSLYKKEKYQFYGDCVIGAYLLESNISKNPIIVVDEETYVDIKTVKGYEEFIGSHQERHYVKPFACINNDVVLDIDETFEFKKFDNSQIEANILKNKRAFEYDASNYAKYVFLMNELENK